MGRIAIVDNDVDNAEMMKVILEDRHQVEAFTDCREFLTHVVARSFDLIILDLVMPEMDGFEVFALIHEGSPGLPVIAVTGKAFPKDREAVLNAGFCDYYAKPIMDIEHFRQTVFKHVGECKNPPYRKSA